MKNRDRFFRQLGGKYSPESFGTNSLYEKVFQPLVEQKEIDFFFELYEKNDIEPKAWGFLGIYHFLKEKTLEDLKYNFPLERLHGIIKDILNDEREVIFTSCSQTIQTSLREHHFKRVCWLDLSLIFKPVLEYCETFDKETDNVIAGLSESVLTKKSNLKVEQIIINFAKKVPKNKLERKYKLINAFENLGEILELGEKDAIGNIFKTYLEDCEELNKESTLKSKILRLKQNIFRTAAVLDLDLETETLKFVGSLKNPYSGLYHIAQKYHNNEMLKASLLNILEKYDNPYLITDVLKAILVIKDGIKNWKELILDYIIKFQLVDEELINKIYKENLLGEDVLINFLKDGQNWQLVFLRDFLINNPELIEKWINFQELLINILKSFESDDNSHLNFIEKKEFALKLVIDLERKDLVEYCLDNFENLEDDRLKKISLFALITYGNDNIWYKLRQLMEKDSEISEYVKKFWAHLKRNDWKFHI